MDEKEDMDNLYGGWWYSIWYRDSKETGWTEYYWLMLVEALSSIISHLVAGYMVIDYVVDGGLKIEVRCD